MDIAGCSGDDHLSLSLTVCCLALFIEALVGYPQPLFRVVTHPVMWVGALIARLDRLWNRQDDRPARRRLAGAGAMAVLLTASGLPVWLVTLAVTAALQPVLAALVLGVLASSCLAQRSLDAHVCAVADALDRDGLAAARRSVADIVGRDTTALDTAGVARAAIESLAENFADGVVAPAFWLAIFGLPGGVLYKAINTADSMIGHRTPRHAAYGFCAAKLDDAASWPGSRLAAAWLVLAAGLSRTTSMRGAWRVMRRDARGHPSPNAGWPEAAMAGALHVRLAGPRIYAGHQVDDAFIGDGERVVDASTIRAALRLYRTACGIQFLFVFAVAILIWQWR